MPLGEPLLTYRGYRFRLHDGPSSFSSCVCFAFFRVGVRDVVVVAVVVVAVVVVVVVVVAIATSIGPIHRIYS